MNDSPKRERGFYWIRQKLGNHGPNGWEPKEWGEPEVAFWRETTEGWFITGNDYDLMDWDVEVLSARLEPPATG